MDLFRAPSVSDLIQNNFGDLYLCAANPCDTFLVNFDLCRENGGQTTLSLTLIIS
jgi:hypothetical protein